MKKNFIRWSVKILILIILFSGITFFLKADVEAMYNRNYIVSKSTTLKIQPRTSGCIYFKLAKGEYRINIRTLRYSNLMLNDSIESNMKETYYPDMSPGQYVYNLKTNKSALYEQCYITTTMSARLRIEILKK